MDYKDKSDNYFENARKDMLQFFPDNAERVLDIGCGNGAFGLILKQKYDVETWGIELVEEQGMQAQKVLDKVFIGACETYLNDLPENYFDAIFFNDVLEHLFNPYEVLAIIRNKLSSKGVVISSIPNVRHYKNFKQLFFKKNWDYQESGTMDFTHVRFFTVNSIPKMYREAGYKILLHKGTNRTKSLMPYLYNVPFLFTAMDIFYLQFVTVATKRNGE